MLTYSEEELRSIYLDNIDNFIKKEKFYNSLVKIMINKVSSGEDLEKLFNFMLENKLNIDYDFFINHKYLTKDMYNYIIPRYSISIKTLFSLPYSKEKLEDIKLEAKKAYQNFINSHNNFFDDKISEYADANLYTHEEIKNIIIKSIVDFNYVRFYLFKFIDEESFVYIYKQYFNTPLVYPEVKRFLKVENLPIIVFKDIMAKINVKDYQNCLNTKILRDIYNDIETYNLFSKHKFTRENIEDILKQKINLKSFE